MLLHENCIMNETHIMSLLCYSIIDKCNGPDGYARNCMAHMEIAEVECFVLIC